MEFNEALNRLTRYPNYMDTGAGKLGKLWNVSPDDIRLAKKIVIANRKKKFNAQKNVNPQRTSPKILIFDIETSPMRAYVWNRWKQNIYLDQTISEWFMIGWSAKWLYSADIMSDILTPDEIRNEDDSRIIGGLWKLINEANIVVAHNGNSFDIPKMNSRFIFNGYAPTKPYFSVDTKSISSKQFGFSSNKLDALAGYFGIEHKDNISFELWKKCMDGDIESLLYMRNYNEKDVAILEEIYIRLRPWVKNHPNISLFNNVETCQCSYCGSNEVDKIDGKLYYTSVGGYEMFRCSECGGISRGRKTVIDKSKNKHLLVSVGK